MQKILIIEDEKALLKALTLKLSNEEFQVLSAEDGEEGLKVALTEHPNLILLDIVMPAMDGLTVLKKIRADNWGKNAKVIVLSNLSMEGRVDEVKNNQIEDYLIKSDWSLEDIVDKVKQSLSN